MEGLTHNQKRHTGFSNIHKYRIEIGTLIILLTIFTRIGFAQKTHVKSTKASNEEEKPPFRASVRTEQKWIDDSLERHNYLRSLHNSQKLVLNNTLSEISQAWSNYLLKKGIESFNKSGEVEFFKHNPARKGVGENLYYVIDYVKPNGSIAVTLWYNEIKDYDFEFATVKTTSKPNSQIGHLTQLLWNETTQMGTAYATVKLENGQTMTFVTANYFPAGNVHVHGNFPLKKYLQNVFPPISGAKNEVEDVESLIHNKILRWEIPREDLTTPKSWIEAALQKHNEFRGNVHFPHITIHYQLCEVAQSSANKLLKKGVEDFNRDLMIKHFTNNFGATEKAKFGENMMYFISDGLVDPTFPVNLWYQQKQFYDFKSRRTNHTKSTTARTENFEQVIWKETTHMGIAFASAQLENGQILSFIVANYYPGGQKRSFQERMQNIQNTSMSLFKNRWPMSWLG